MGNAPLPGTGRLKLMALEQEKDRNIGWIDPLK